jgi:hypothetical protein
VGVANAGALSKLSSAAPARARATALALKLAASFSESVTVTVDLDRPHRVGVTLGPLAAPDSG